MREVLITRIWTDDQGTEGILQTKGFSCHTLELPWRDNTPNMSCIPAGEYVIRFIKLRRNRYIGGINRMYWVEKVGGRSGILLHAGTFAGDALLKYLKNSFGCPLLGMTTGIYKKQKAIFRSQEAVRKFHKVMGKKPARLIVKEAY